MLQMKSAWSLGVLFLALLVNLVLVAPLLATTYTYDLSGPNVVVPSGTTFTSNGVTITAYGFQGIVPTSGSDTTATQVDLYEKNTGGGETGLGISGVATGDSTNEIVTTDKGTFYVQLDLTNLLAASANPFLVVSESVQAGEQYQFWKSDTLGLLGTQIGSNACGFDFCTETFTLSASNPFLSLSAPSVDVLLKSLTTSTAVPEPSSLLLLGSGIAGLGFWRLRRNKNR